jgi:hypothetical protein
MRRHERDCRRQTENDLRKARVRDRDRVRQVPENSDAAEDSLRDDRGERDISETPDPRPWLRSIEPDCQYDDQKADRTGDQTMQVFIKNAADHLAQRERPHQPAVGVGPVGDGQARASARDEPARKNQSSSGCRNQRGKKRKHPTP